ncbi:hypothetical protein ACHAW5_001766 [Stephanodiscus triporus]|uniref:CRAL-TRIO domain-containing protein n=1 Tax=Stephanodiscus triporus TaxID=2934178 RepID=A0ABD3PBD2_9STRA
MTSSSGTGGNQCPIFEGLSPDIPSILTVSFASDPRGSLGVQLANHDNGLTNEMFLPGYASVGRMLDSDPTAATTATTTAAATASTTTKTTTTTTTLARRCGVKVGDIIVAVNGVGYRRFPPDHDEASLVDVTLGIDLITLTSEEEGDEEREGAAVDASAANFAHTEGGHRPTSSVDEERKEREEKRERRGEFDKSRTITSARPGESYAKLLLKIRNVKSSSNPDDPPLVLSLERHGWDSRAHSWSRFLSARNGDVPAAMALIQGHERWRSEFFPIDLTEPSLQRLLKSRAVSVIDHLCDGRGMGRRGGGGRGEEDDDDDDDVKAPVVYIDFAMLQRTGAESDTLSSDVVKAFVVYTETLLSKSPDPRRPKSSQFVDLTGVSIKQGLQPGVLKKLYATFEPNYPETLEKMVLYPVPRLMVRAVNAMLSFVNEHTRKKFVITDDLDLVCKELGWDANEIEGCGGVNGYMKKHLHHGSSFVFD